MKKEIKHPILKEVLEYTHTNMSSLAKKIGIVPQILYDINDGKIKNISFKIATLINEIYPELNIKYMMGDGGKLINTNKIGAVKDQDLFNAVVLERLAEIQSKINGTLFSRELDALKQTIGQN